MKHKFYDGIGFTVVALIGVGLIALPMVGLLYFFSWEPVGTTAFKIIVGFWAFAWFCSVAGDLSTSSKLLKEIRDELKKRPPSS